MKKLNDYRLQLGEKAYVPIMIGGMGVDISTADLALVASRLGGIGHISDAMMPTVTDRRFKTTYVKDKLAKYKYNVDNPDKSDVRFNLDEIAEAIAREKQLKRWHRPWKIRLIEETNRDWQDLALTLGFEPLSE